jgi:hypothetical protein
LSGIALQLELGHCYHILQLLLTVITVELELLVNLSSIPLAYYLSIYPNFRNIWLSQAMASVSTLPPPALQASRAALASALAEQPVQNESSDTLNEGSLEDGEIQEVDMQAQAEGIRTVFNDPTNFNVKVSIHLLYCDSQLIYFLAPALLTMDPLVRLAGYQRAESATNTRHCVSSDTCPLDAWGGRCDGLDGRYQTRYKLR